jgi:hypothetical protein
MLLTTYILGMDTNTVNTLWHGVDLSLNRQAFEMAKAEFMFLTGRKPETLAELQSVWRRQSTILTSLEGEQS